MSQEIIKSVLEKVEKDRNGKITSNITAVRWGLNTDWFVEQIKVSLGNYVKSLPPQKQAALAIGMIQGSDQLKTCDPVSIFGSILQVSNLGLSLDGFRGEAYLTPFWNGKKSRLEAKPMIGYRGLHKKLIDSGAVKKAEAVLVREADFFEYEKGDNQKLIHKPNLKDSRSPISGAWAGIWLLNGEKQYDYMPISEIEDIRSRSKSAFDKDGNLAGPWKTDFGEMARKTVLRRLAKWASVSPDATKAAMLEEYAENANTSFKVIEGEIDYFADEDVSQEITQPKKDDGEKRKVINSGEAKRLQLLLDKHKKRTDENLKSDILAPLGLEKLEDLPLDIYPDVCLWAEGKDFAKGE